MILPAPFDAHVHFRQDEMLSVARHHDKVFEYAIAMPNTDPPILTGEDADVYKANILKHCGRMKPLMTIKLVPGMDPNIIKRAAKNNQIVGCKLYTDNMTTGSHGGWSRHHLYNPAKYLYPLCEEMQDSGIVCEMHGEMPPIPGQDDFCLDREQSFFYVVRDLCRNFPKMRFVLEHITTKDAVDFVRLFPNLAATITYHHMVITLNDLIGGPKFKVHNFCKPLAQRPIDRKALIAAATDIDEDDRFLLGSDSAPHTIGKKECAEGCAGCYTAVGLMEGLANVFDKAGSLKTLKYFSSATGRNWYRLPAPGYEIVMERKEFVVPMEADGCVPFQAGHKYDWSVVS